MANTTAHTRPAQSNTARNRIQYPVPGELRPDMGPRRVDLTSSERRSVALASLALLESEHLLRLGQIRAERRALLAGVAT